MLLQVNMQRATVPDNESEIFQRPSSIIFLDDGILNLAFKK